MSILVEEPVVLAIGARLGDIESVCAGTLALLSERGWRVATAAMVRSHPQMDNAAFAAGADVPQIDGGDCLAAPDGLRHCLDCPEFGVTYGDDLCRRTAGLLRAIRPAVVLTHGPEGMTPDQEETSRIVRQACLAAPAEHYETDCDADASTPTVRTPHLYYVDPPALTDCLGHLVEASLVVDVSTAMEAKTRLLVRIAAQAGGTSTGQTVDEHLQHVRTWAHERGDRVGCAFGEGFRQLRGPAYPRDGLLEQVLGPLAHNAG